MGRRKSKANKRKPFLRNRKLCSDLTISESNHANTEKNGLDAIKNEQSKVPDVGVVSFEKENSYANQKQKATENIKSSIDVDNAPKFALKYLLLGNYVNTGSVSKEPIFPDVGTNLVILLDDALRMYLNILLYFSYILCPSISGFSTIISSVVNVARYLIANILFAKTQNEIHYEILVEKISNLDRGIEKIAKVQIEMQKKLQSNSNLSPCGSSSSSSSNLQIITSSSPTPPPPPPPPLPPIISTTLNKKKKHTVKHQSATNSSSNKENERSIKSNSNSSAPMDLMTELKQFQGKKNLRQTKTVGVLGDSSNMAKKESHDFLSELKARQRVRSQMSKTEFKSPRSERRVMKVPLSNVTIYDVPGCARGNLIEKRHGEMSSRL